MKIKIAFFITLILAFTAVSFAQSVKITSKKVTYKRTGKNVPDYKKTFEINYPVVAGANGKKIEAILSYEKNFDFKIAEEQKETFWLETADYTVNYNKNNILDVTIMIEGSGAYPSSSSKYLVVNTKTGTRIKPSDVFTNLNGLAALGAKSQIAEMKTEAARIKKDEPDFDPSEYFNNAKFTTENLWAFTVSDKGITFHYDYGFPHVALALQPDGEYAFSWAELKPFIKKEGLFGVFVK
ncbi:MAG: hypothetical protein K1X72_03175 [Pyrinomonadaceae bacterium]|nr:hypothetical protein [Pyrinomonadaceae bacterium]